MVLKFFLFALLLLLISCSIPERDNPYDPKNPNYILKNACWSPSSPSRQEGPLVELDVIIRDFPVTSPGFEEFDSQKGDNRKCNGDNATKGMVGNTLYYDKANCLKENIIAKDGDPDYIRYRYCARPMPANLMCYGENLQSWYSDGGQARTIYDIMTLAQKNDGRYEIMYNNTTLVNWNGYGATAGYFPLDKYDDYTWGKQSLAAWCPSQTDAIGTCATWWAQGGPKEPDAAIKVANNQSNLRKDLHNFGFTIVGSAEFKYVDANNDNIAFTGDDDMWVFIDGELVMDLGGVHQALSDSVSINNIARARGWADGTMHSINFFYAERQTPESNLRLAFRLTDLSPPRFGAPRILKVESNAREAMIWVSTKLDFESLGKFQGSDQFPIIIIRPDSKDVEGYKLSSIEFVGSDGSNGYVYIITGSVCESKNDCTNKLSCEDTLSLSFNVTHGDLVDAGYSDSKGFTLPDESWYVKSSTGKPATKLSWIELVPTGL
ncbi:MAG: fibro-slime domain-containing protein [Fibromonadaceae bacterium]|jgi:fibro-slime domain-containing protein|nr:fibro-slime domain-containing protein [Fibromonadaceae bacterium]